MQRARPSQGDRKRFVKGLMDRRPFPLKDREGRQSIDRQSTDLYLRVGHPLTRSPSMRSAAERTGSRCSLRRTSLGLCSGGTSAAPSIPLAWVIALTPDHGHPAVVRYPPM